MMEPKFGKNPGIPSCRMDLDQMPDTPTRGAHHRRSHSDTFFRFPDLYDILIDDVVTVLDLDLDLPPTAPSLLPNVPPLPPPSTLQSNKTGESRPGGLLRSLSVDADFFFDGLGFDAPPAAAEVGPDQGRRHRHSNSMDGYSSATSFEFDSNVKKAMADERVKELALIDPKRAKRILANRQSAARSKERKVRYTGELERKVQTLQTEATTLSAQITSLQRDTTGLTSENKELKFKLQALEQQAHLRDALNEALKNELQHLKIAAGQIPTVNGNNKGSNSQFSSQSQTFNYYSNQQHEEEQEQQFHMPQSGSNNHTYSGFNRRV